MTGGSVDSTAPAAATLALARAMVRALPGALPPLPTGLPVLATLLLAVLAPAPSTAQDTLRLEGLERPVEIVKDTWGVSHIYAETEEDLFFAQGFNAARDRLFQLEMWRRQATGTVAEILGPRELERDIGTRLFRFRGDMDEELAHYHPRGRRSSRRTSGA